MITKEQIRAARGWLGWSQVDLARESGVGENTIYNIECGETTDPRKGTVRDIELAFLRHGVEFKPDGGIGPRTVSIIRFEGEGWYLRLLDDVYKTLMDKKDGELLFFGSDDRASPEEVNGRIRKMRNAGIKMRQLVEEENTYLLGPVKEYRYISKKNFKNNVTIVYGDKVAVCTANNTMAMVFDDKPMSEAWGRLFEELWDNLKQPTRSDANEKDRF